MSLALVPMQSFFDIVDNLSLETVSSAQTVSIAIAVVIFLLWAGAARFKPATVIIAFLCCAAGVWAVHNMDFGRSTVNDTITSTGGAATANAKP